VRYSRGLEKATYPKRRELVNTTYSNVPYLLPLPIIYAHVHMITSFVVMWPYADLSKVVDRNIFNNGSHLADLSKEVT
jgi:hypothetical protein